MKVSSRPRGQKLCVRTLLLMLTCKLLGSHSLQFELRPIRALAIESVAVAQRTTSTGPHILLSHQLETPLSLSHLTGIAWLLGAFAVYGTSRRHLHLRRPYSLFRDRALCPASRPARSTGGAATNTSTRTKHTQHNSTNPTRVQSR